MLELHGELSHTVGALCMLLSLHCRHSEIPVPRPGHMETYRPPASLCGQVSLFHSLSDNLPVSGYEPLRDIGFCTHTRCDALPAIGFTTATSTCSSVLRFSAERRMDVGAVETV